MNAHLPCRHAAAHAHGLKLLTRTSSPAGRSWCAYGKCRPALVCRRETQAAALANGSAGGDGALEVLQRLSTHDARASHRDTLRLPR